MQYIFLQRRPSSTLVYRTRWTFFRVKLVCECEFEISWSLGPLDLGTLGPLPTSNTSWYFPLHPLTSSYPFLLLSFFGMVWLWGGEGVVTLENEIGIGTSSFLLHSLPLTSSHLLLIPPSYSTLLPNILLTPPTSSRGVSHDYSVHT